MKTTVFFAKESLRFSSIRQHNKTFPVGAGVREIRVKGTDGIYRGMYVAKFEESVYVLHCQKKTQPTSQPDVQLPVNDSENLFRSVKPDNSEIRMRMGCHQPHT